MSEDIKYMQRALFLASKSLISVAPNPMVGCVIVYQDKIIGEGYHKKFGGNHAEVEALNSVQDKNILSKSTIYITLEPCVHYGKTPPCVDELLKYAPKRVVISMLDPNPKVGGKGLEKLKQAQIQTTLGVCEEESRQLNKRFLTFFTKKRPYIILKWAETKDGFIALSDFKNIKITSVLSDYFVHQLRAQTMGIMVGKKTAFYDNPKLNVRHGIIDNQPIRIILDSNLEIKPTHHIFDSTQTTLLYNSKLNKEEGRNFWIKKHSLPEILEDLYQRTIHSVFVEGGAKLIQSFLEHNLYDEIISIQNQNLKIEKGIQSPLISKNFSKIIKRENDTWMILEKSLVFGQGNGFV